MAIVYFLVAWLIASFIAALIRQYLIRLPTPIPFWKDFILIVFIPILLTVTVSLKLLRWIL